MPSIVDANKIIIIPGQNYFVSDNINISLNNTPTIINNELYIPIRQIANCMDRDVVWNDGECTLTKGGNNNMSILGFDTDVVLTPEVCAQMKGFGYNFVVRYVSLGSPKNGDITYNELINILNSGLAIFLVQHVPYPGFNANWNLGVQYGNDAVNHAKSAGYAPGNTISLDLEGVANSGQDVINYCTAWHDTVKNAGYCTCIYIGAQCGLTGEQISALPFDNFWRSCSTVPDISGKGYCMQQTCDNSFTWPIDYDKDVMYRDNYGTVPKMMSKVAIYV